jgi:hypothetical protein
MAHVPQGSIIVVTETKVPYSLLSSPTLATIAMNIFEAGGAEDFLGLYICLDSSQYLEATTLNLSFMSLTTHMFDQNFAFLLVLVML